MNSEEGSARPFRKVKDSFSVEERLLTSVIVKRPASKLLAKTTDLKKKTYDSSKNELIILALREYEVPAEFVVGRRVQVNDLTELHINSKVLLDLSPDDLHKPSDGIRPISGLIQSQGTTPSVLQVKI